MSSEARSNATRAKSDPIFDRCVQQVVDGFDLWMFMMKTYVTAPDVSQHSATAQINVRFGDREFAYKKSEIIGMYKASLRPALSRLKMIHRVLISSRKRAGQNVGLTMPRLLALTPEGNAIIEFIKVHVFNAFDRYLAKYVQDKEHQNVDHTVSRHFDALCLSNHVINMSTFTPLFVLYAQLAKVPKMDGQKKLYNIAGTALAETFAVILNAITYTNPKGVYQNYLGPIEVGGVTIPQRGFANTNILTLMKTYLSPIPSYKEDSSYTPEQYAAIQSTINVFPSQFNVVNNEGLFDNEQYKLYYETLSNSVRECNRYISQLNTQFKIARDYYEQINYVV